MSLVNHACNPSSFIIHTGNILVLRARRFMTPGEEVTISYGPLYGHEDRIDRREQLMSDYYFNCTCSACENDWPTVHKVTTFIFLKCPKCLKTVNTVTGKPPCKHLNWLYVMTKIGKEAMVYSCMKTAGKPLSEDYRNLVSNSVETFDKYCDLPCSNYIVLQEGLMSSFKTEGNHVLIGAE